MNKLIRVFSVVAVFGTIIALSFCPVTQADDNGESCTSSDNVTLEVRILHRGDGGGGGGGGGSCSCSYFLEIDMFGKSSSVEISQNGIVEREFEKTQDEATLEIGKGTSCLDYLGHRLRRLFLEGSSRNVSSEEYVVVDEYTIGSQYRDAHFDPAIELTLFYQEKDIPEGVVESNLVLGYYDTEKEEWHQLKSEVKTSQNAISIELSQLKSDLFGILVPVFQEEEREEGKTKEEEAKAEEEASTYSPYSPSSLPETSGTSTKGTDWFLVTIIIGIIAVVLSILAVVILKKRNRW